MKSIGIYELKAHLSRILGEVEAGAPVVITRNGEPIAEIVPHARRRPIEEIVAELAAIRKRSKKVTLDDWLSWRHEEHRY